MPNRRSRAPQRILVSRWAVPILPSALGDPGGPGAPGSESDRPEQTIAPLSQLLGTAVPLNLNFVKGEEQQVAAAAMACAGVVLIAWQHEDIPAIANAILGRTGIVPPNWPGNRFDVVWVFDLRPDGGYSFSQVPQMLLAGDLPSVIT
jgi:hypothetical protein